MDTAGHGLRKLPEEFYQQPDVVAIARRLLGKLLVTHIAGQYTAGMITETEAYAGETDRASHAFGGKRTKRTETLYRDGGIAYVYLCYGMHHLFNVVTYSRNYPHAVLIRALKPTMEFDTIAQRLGYAKNKTLLLNGPGKISKAMGITTALNATSLLGNIIWIEDIGCDIPDSLIHTGPRIGVDYAGTHALWPMRFWVNSEKDLPDLSKDFELQRVSPLRKVILK